jgi:hypothetical protein
MNKPCAFIANETLGLAVAVETYNMPDWMRKGVRMKPKPPQKSPRNSRLAKKCTVAPRTPAKTQPKTSNPFNPRNLRIAEIVARIRDARIRVLATLQNDLLLAQAILNVRVIAVQKEDGMSHLQTQPTFLSPIEADMLIFPTETMPSGIQPPLFPEEYRGKPAKQLQAVIKEDQALAGQIRMNPTVLLLSPYAKDAIARWTYGALHGHSTEIRKQAKDLLQTACESKPGRPADFKVDRSVLRVARDDLLEYGRGLRACVKKAHSADDVLRYFPDAAELKIAGVDALGDVPHLHFAIPAAHDVAEKVFHYAIGWSRSKMRLTLDSGK